MKLPKGDAAIIEIAKIEQYCLSLIHPRGRHKARVFQSVLGMTVIHAEELRGALAKAARDGDAAIGASDSYGIRYIIDFELERDGRTAIVRSCWIVRSGEFQPRFVTCFVL
jgi:hypothetical protein